MDDDPMPDAQLDEWLRIAQDEDADSAQRTLGSQARNRRIKALIHEVRRERLVREVVEQLYASEVNARLSFYWDWDGGYFWALGDERNRFTDKGGHADLRRPSRSSPLRPRAASRRASSPGGGRAGAWPENRLPAVAELWKRVQSRRADVEGRAVRFESGRLSGRPPRNAAPSLMAGLATCGTCGGGLVVVTSGGPRADAFGIDNLPAPGASLPPGGARGVPYRYYACARRQHTSNCSNALPSASRRWTRQSSRRSRSTP
jgi:hypothetical protein